MNSYVRDHENRINERSLNENRRTINNELENLFRRQGDSNNNINNNNINNNNINNNNINNSEINEPLNLIFDPVAFQEGVMQGLYAASQMGLTAMTAEDIDINSDGFFDRITELPTERSNVDAEIQKRLAQNAEDQEDVKEINNKINELNNQIKEEENQTQQIINENQQEVENNITGIQQNLNNANSAATEANTRYINEYAERTRMINRMLGRAAGWAAVAGTMAFIGSPGGAAIIGMIQSLIRPGVQAIIQQPDSMERIFNFLTTPTGQNVITGIFTATAVKYGAPILKMILRK